MRLFIGIRPNEAIRSTLVKAQEDLAHLGISGSFLLPENLHMTLAFIGEHPDADSCVSFFIERTSWFRVGLSALHYTTWFSFCYLLCVTYVLYSYIRGGKSGSLRDGENQAGGMGGEAPAGVESIPKDRNENGRIPGCEKQRLFAQLGRPVTTKKP